MIEHLVVAPVVLPLAAGAALLLIEERRHRAKALVSISAALFDVGVYLGVVGTTMLAIVSLATASRDGQEH